MTEEEKKILLNLAAIFIEAYWDNDMDTFLEALAREVRKHRVLPIDIEKALFPNG